MNREINALRCETGDRSRNDDRRRCRASSGYGEKVASADMRSDAVDFDVRGSGADCAFDGDGTGRHARAVNGSQNPQCDYARRLLQAACRGAQQHDPGDYNENKGDCSGDNVGAAS